MRIHRLWTRLCVATTTSSLLLLAGNAQAVRRHKMQPGENVHILAKRYHVSARDILRANAISENTILRIDRVLVIPNAPKRVRAKERLNQARRVTGDRVSVRMGPGTGHRRAGMLDTGATVVVTARRGDWAQVTLANGQIGWIRTDYLGRSRRAKAASVQVAKHSPSRRPGSKRVRAQARLVTDRPRIKHRKLARASAKASLASRKKHSEEQRIRRASRAERLRAARAERTRQRRVRAQAWARLHSPRRGRNIPEASRPEASTDIVRTAYSYRGTPYRWGGSSRNGFDCSGFTSHLYRRKGVALPHSASAQARIGKKVSRDSLKPGDLVFFQTVSKGISHVGMYVGEGKFVHASSRRRGGVRVDSLSSGYYNQRFRGARRYKGD